MVNKIQLSLILIRKNVKDYITNYRPNYDHNIVCEILFCMFGLSGKQSSYNISERLLELIHNVLRGNYNIVQCGLDPM